MKSRSLIKTLQLLLSFVVFIGCSAVQAQTKAGMQAMVAPIGNVTLKVTRSPSTMQAGQPFSVQWQTTNANSVSYSCTSPSGGFAGSVYLSQVNGSSTGIAELSWLGRDSNCIWTAEGDTDSISVNETMQTVAASNNAQFQSQDVPTQMVPGQTYPVTIVFKNNSTSSWSEVGAYRLGTQNPQDNATWGINRVLTESVTAGSFKTFTFNVTAPSTPGRYNFQWRMVQEDVQWFGDYTPNVEVNVTSPSVPAQLNLSLIAPSTGTNATVPIGQSFTLGWNLSGVTNQYLVCNDGFNNLVFQDVALQAQGTYTTSAAWAQGRTILCWISAKENGVNRSSSTISITVPAPVSAAMNLSLISPSTGSSATVALGQSFTLAWNLSGVTNQYLVCNDGSNNLVFQDVTLQGQATYTTSAVWAQGSAIRCWVSANENGVTKSSSIISITVPAPASAAMNLSLISPSTGTGATVAIGQSFTLGWNLSGVTNQYLVCNDGFSNLVIEDVALQGQGTYTTSAAWAQGRTILCRISAKENGVTKSSSTISITVPAPAPAVMNLSLVSPSTGSSATVAIGQSFTLGWNLSGVTNQYLVCNDGFSNLVIQDVALQGQGTYTTSAAWAQGRTVLCWIFAKENGVNKSSSTISITVPAPQPAVLNLLITAPSTPPNTSTNATVIVGGDIALSWNLSGVTDSILECTDGVTTYDRAPVPLQGQRIFAARAEWVIGRNIGCVVIAKASTDGATVTSSMVWILVKPIPTTISVVRSTPIRADLPFTTTWSTNGDTLSYSCTANASGFNGSGSLPTNGKETKIAQEGWIGNPSTCTWTATGPGGTKTLTETLTTIPEYDVSAACLAQTPKSGIYTGSLVGGNVWGNNNTGFTVDSHLAKAIVHAGLVTDGASAYIRIKPIGTSSGFIGTTANGIASTNYASSWCAMKLSIGDGNALPLPTIAVKRNPTILKANHGFNTTVTTTNATSVTYSCTANNGGFNGSGSMPINGTSESSIALAAWVENPSICTWSAIGPSGTTSITEILTTDPEPPVSASCLASTPKSGIYTGSLSGMLWGDNINGFTYDSNLGSALVHAGLLAVGSSSYITITPLGIVSDFTGSTANGVTSTSYAKPYCAIRLSIGSGNGLPEPTIKVTRNPTPLLANRSYTTTWETTNATSVSYSCVANNGGFSGDGTLGINGTSAASIASPSWVNNPSVCTWKATGPGGTKTITEVMTTDPEPPVSAACLAQLPASGIYTGTLAGGDVWGNNEGGYAFESYLGRALVHSGLLAVGASEHITIASLDKVSSFTGTTANGVTSRSYGSPGCAIKLSVGGGKNLPKPTIVVTRNPSTLIANRAYTTTWATTNATSVTFSCTANSGGFDGIGTLPINGTSAPNIASSGWVGNPSTCTWTAIGPSGTTTITETLRTDPEPPVSAACLSKTPLSGTYTGSLSGGSVWGTNENGYTVDSHLGKALVHSGLLAEGVSGAITITPIDSVSSFVGTSANGVTTTSYASPWCAMKLSKTNITTPPSVTLQSTNSNVRVAQGQLATVSFVGQSSQSSGQVTKLELLKNSGSGYSSNPVNITTGSTSNLSYAYNVQVSSGSYRFKLRATNQSNVTTDSNEVIVNVTDASLLGEISGIRANNSGLLQLHGWACQDTNTQVLNYKVYADAPSILGGIQIASGVADIATESNQSDVENKCHTPGVGHHFVADLSDLSNPYQGKRLFVEVATSGNALKATLPCADNNCTMPGAIRIGLTTPQNNDRYTGPAIVFMRAKIDNGNGIYDELAFNINDEWINATPDSEPGTYTAMKVGVPSRTTPYPVVAKVRQGNTTIYSGENLIYVDAVNNGVSLKITKPANNQTVNRGKAVDLLAYANILQGSTAQIYSIKFYINDVFVANGVNAGSGNWTAAWTPAQIGTARIVATAYDANGLVLNSSSASVVSVTIDVDLPPALSELSAVPITPLHLTNPDAGTLPGNLQVGNDGTASYEIPIVVPPGTAGMQPSLSLNYNSNGSNGHIGYGWSLGGLSTIYRCPKTIAQDGVAGRISFDNADRLCLDGKRLIRVNGTDLGTNVAAIDNAYWVTDTAPEYRTELESFSRVTRQASGGFKVESKDGNIRYYGTQSNSAIIAQGRSDGQIMIWALERIEDRMGNYVEVDYSQNTSELNGSSDVNTGEYLPRQIRYGAANASSDLAVKFKYEQRFDAQVQYMAGSRNDLRSRLTHIQTYVGTSGDGSGGSLVRDYEVHYRLADTTKISRRSLVDWIQACATNPQTMQMECLPKTSFEWGSNGTPVMTALPIPQIVQPKTQPQVMPQTVPGVTYGAGLASDYFGDLDGSGKTSWIRNRKLDCEMYKPRHVCGLTYPGGIPIPYPTIPNNLKIRLPNGAEIERLLDLSGAGLPANAVLKILVGDLDGDGRDDLILEDQTSGRQSWGYCLTVSSASNEVDFVCHPKPLGSPAIAPSQSPILIDLNRDHRMHVLLPFDASGVGGDCSLVNGAMQCQPIQMTNLTPLPANAWWDSGRTMSVAINLSKQGKPDLIMTSQYLIPTEFGSDTYATNPSGQRIKVDIKSRVMLCINKMIGLECTAIRPDSSAYSLQSVTATSGDVNNDGLADILISEKRSIGGSPFAYEYLCLSKELGMECGQGNTKNIVLGDFGNMSNSGEIADFFGDGSNRILAGLSKQTGDTYQTIAHQLLSYSPSGFVGDSYSISHELSVALAPLFFDESGIPAFWGPYFPLNGSYGFPYAEISTAYKLAVPANQDKIIAVTNGVGYREELDYARGDDASVYRRHALIDGAEVRPTYPQLAVPPSTMVKEYRRSNGKGGWIRNTYSYEGAKSDAFGRGSLGFSKVTVTDVANNIITTSILSQNYPYIGSVLRSTSTHSGATIKAVINQPAQQIMSYGSGKSTIFTFTSNSIAVSHDLDGSDLGSQVIDNKYEDGWGNLTTQNITNSISGGLSFSTSKFTQFKNDSNLWLLGLPQKEQTTKTESTYGAITRTLDKTYDPVTGLLLTETQEKGNPLYEVVNTYLRNRNPFGLVNNKVQSWLDPVTQTTLKRTVSSVDYDVRGRFIELMWNALNQTERRTYDASTGMMLSQTDPNLLTKSWEFDGFGRITKETNIDGSYVLHYRKQCDRACPSIATIAEVSDYFSKGNLRMAVPSMTYRDSAGHVVQQGSYGFDGRKILTDQNYDEQGRLFEVYHPRFECDIGCARPQDDTLYLSRRQYYDDLQRVIRVEVLDETGQIMPSTTQFTGLKQIVTNAKKQNRTETRDVLGQLRKVQDAMLGITSFEYDAFGGLKQTSDPNSNLIKINYDLLGRKTELNDPDLGRIEYKVDPVGRVWQQVSPMQRPNPTAIMTYDLLDRLKTRIEPSLISRWEYDGAVNGIGKLSVATTQNINGIETYRRVHTYDEKSRPQITVQNLSDGKYASTTTYDAWGRISSQKHQRNDAAATLFSQRYNNYGYLAQVVRSGKETNAIDLVLWQANTLDASKRVRESVFGNGLLQSRSYNEYSARLVGANLVKAASPQGQARLTEDYAYDALGNVIQRTQYWDTVGFIEHFEYDDLNRIKLSSIGAVTESYTYDYAGNILTKGNVANGATYDYQQQGANAVRPHAVKSIPGVGAFTYDDNGNLKTSAGRSFTWTSFDMPDTISSGSQTSSFVYGPEHQRTRQDKSDGSRIVYAGSMEVEGPLGAPTSIKTYWPNGLGVEIEKNGSTKLYWNHADRLGSPVALTDEVGNLAEKMAYDTWGKRRNLNGIGTPNELDGQIDNKGFTGHEMLDQLDLVHMNGRIYDPLLAKFVSADPHVTDPTNGQNYNRYSYVLNNPTNLTDPTGFDIWEDTKKWWSTTWFGKDNSSSKEAESAKAKAVQTAAIRSEGENKDAANTGGGGCSMGHAGTACHLAGMKQHPEETKTVLKMVVPGAGLSDVHEDFKNGAYGMAVFGAVTEIPALKWLKWGKLGKLGKLEEIGAKEAPTLFRGGINLEARLGVDVKAAEDGLIHALSKSGKPQGLSLNVNPTDTFIQKYGGAFPVNSLPEGLQVLQSGKAGHFVISPSTPMPFEKFQQLLNKVELGNFNKIP